jgi:hypothetical protein
MSFQSRQAGQSLNPLSTALPEDQARLQRRRALAEAMMQSAGNSQGKMVSGHYIRGSGLGNVAQLIGGALMQRGLEADEQAAATRGQEALRTGLEQFMRTRSGAPGDVMTDQQAADLMLNDQAPTLREPVQADPRKAVIDAMTSQHPMLQQLGQAELGQLLAPPPKREIKEAGGQFYDLSSGKPVLLGGTEYGPTEVINGDLYQRGPGGKLVKLDNAPKITTNVNNVQGAGLKKYQEKVGESLAPGGASRMAAEQGRDVVIGAVEALQALNDGARMGIAQPAMQIVRKLGAELGIANADTAPTDALSSALKASVFKDLGGLGAQISDGDRKFVNEFSGDLTTDPAALKRMLAIRISANLLKQQQHNRNAQAFGESVEDPNFAAMAGVPIGVQIPDDEVAQMVSNVLQGKPTTAGMAAPAGGRPGTRGGQQAIPLEQYLQQLRGGR